MALYKRVIFKLSGEALGKEKNKITGEDKEIFDFEKINDTAKMIREMHDMGVEIAIVIGAGNIWRGRNAASMTMDPVAADQMGMLGTVLNCICMADALRQQGLDAVVMSAVDMTRFCEPFNAMAARRHLSEGRVVLFAGGSGNPFFSTDTAVALRAVEIQADVILMAKAIDGVYDADPNKVEDAKLLKDLTYAEALKRGLKVMDAAAFAICNEQNMPLVRVFGLDNPRNLIKVLEGDEMGSFVHP